MKVRMKEKGLLAYIKMSDNIIHFICTENTHTTLSPHDKKKPKQINSNNNTITQISMISVFRTHIKIIIDFPAVFYLI